jgi:hypothetical protein
VLTTNTATVMPKIKPAMTSDGWCLLSVTRPMPQSKEANINPLWRKIFRIRENFICRRAWIYICTKQNNEFRSLLLIDDAIRQKVIFLFVCLNITIYMYSQIVHLIVFTGKFKSMLLNGCPIIKMNTLQVLFCIIKPYIYTKKYMYVCHKNCEFQKKR